jgi:hypothetical protein
MRLFVDRHARCHNCGRDVGRTRKTGRFWLCDECWEAIVPEIEGAIEAGSPEHKANIRYHDWYNDMERRYPVGGRYTFRSVDHLPIPMERNPFYRASQYRSWRSPAGPRLGVASYYPACECGRERPVSQFITGGPQLSIFGPPRRHKCAVCDAREAVEAIAVMADKIHPDWDDEDWLDLLYQSHREAFRVGVLPNLWFELRREPVR